MQYMRDDKASIMDCDTEKYVQNVTEVTMTYLIKIVGGLWRQKVQCACSDI